MESPSLKMELTNRANSYALIESLQLSLHWVVVTAKSVVGSSEYTKGERGEWCGFTWRQIGGMGVALSRTR